MTDGRRRVLIVEDEPIVAMDLELTFQDWGWCVLGPAGHLAEAEALTRDALPDFALLDVNLGPDTTLDLARDLLARGARVAFLSGQDGGTLPGDLAACPALSKPVDLAALRRLAGTPRHLP